MTTPRPGAVTAICSLAIIGALIDFFYLQFNYWETEDPAQLAFQKAHPTGAKVDLFVSYSLAALVVFLCYFMLRAKNWARWSYLILCGARYALAFVLLALNSVPEPLVALHFRGKLVLSFLFFLVALIVLLLPASREYFAEGGRPWWRVDQEREEEEERKRNKK